MSNCSGSGSSKGGGGASTKKADNSIPQNTAFSKQDINIISKAMQDQEDVINTRDQWQSDVNNANKQDINNPKYRNDSGSGWLVTASRHPELNLEKRNEVLVKQAEKIYNNLLKVPDIKILDKMRGGILGLGSDKKSLKDILNEIEFRKSVKLPMSKPASEATSEQKDKFKTFKPIW